MSRVNVALQGLKEAGARISVLNPLVTDIVGALLDLGGAAHRDLVVAHVAGRSGVYRPPETLKRELHAAFSDYCQGATDPRGTGLLHLPHGPRSHRWALTDWAHELLRAGLRRDEAAFRS